MSVSERFDRRLLERHKPLYRLDSQETYGMLAALSMTDNPGNSLIRADGAVVAESDELSLGTLEAYPRGRSQGGDQLAHADGRFEDATEMELGLRGARFPDRVYARVLEDAEHTWLQYWSWHYHNPKRILGIGEHEGDWELVQIALAGGRAREVTFAQHDGGEARAWESVERTDRGRRPLVFVAPFSHAAYFEAGTQAYGFRFLADNPDGGGPQVNPRLARFGDWAAWPGRWGRTRSIPGVPGGTGPRSPGRQSVRWEDPARFHREARKRRDREERLGWRLGRFTYPRDPLGLEAVEAREGLIRVRYELPWFRSGSRLLITAHDPDRSGTRLIGREWIKWPGRTRIAEVPLVAMPRGETIVVRASAFNAIDQRSNCVETRATIRDGRVMHRRRRLRRCG